MYIAGQAVATGFRSVVHAVDADIKDDLGKQPFKDWDKNLESGKKTTILRKINNKKHTSLF